MHCGELIESQYDGMRSILFLTGASGAGKTSTIETLEPDYNNTLAFIHTDDFGVPSPEEMVRLYVGGNGYQRHIFNHWIDYSKSYIHDKFVIIEGSLIPSIIIEGCKDENISAHRVLLFDCDDVTRKQRLNQRGHPDIATTDMTSLEL